jgi:hypothetical protein
MQNCCVLLGAGASYYATGFLGSGLLDAIRPMLAQRRSIATLDQLLELADSDQHVAANFEAFLSQISAWAAVVDARGWPLSAQGISLPISAADGADAGQLLNELLLDLQRAIAVACDCPLPSSLVSSPYDGTSWGVTPHEALLAKLSSRDPLHGRAKVFTTNYDTLVEQAMDRLGVLYSDGFTGTVSRRFNPAAYDVDVYFPGEATEGQVRRFDKYLHLYKLHGSTTWRRREAGAGYEEVAFDSTPLPRRERFAAAGANAVSLDAVFSHGEGLAILPTLNKYAETLALPFAHMFRAFSHALSLPQTVLFIVGYSGWDEHVNRLVVDALTNPGFACVIVDPAPSPWAKALCAADYCGRVYIFGGPWARFEFFAANLLPDLDVLGTDLEIARTLRDLAAPAAESGRDAEDQESRDG